MNDEAELTIIGTPPNLANHLCDELLCEQYWHKGELVEAANVLYIRCADVWHRLAFDQGMIFWRSQAERPAPYSMPELRSETRIDNLGGRSGLAGCRLVSYSARAVVDGSEITFLFEGGRTLTVRNISDHTSCVI